MIEDVEDPTLELEPAPVDGSLSARMRERAELLEKRTTERFPIPGWDELLEVELRLLGYQAISKTIKRNQRERREEIRELYSLCDQILNATVGFFEVMADGQRRPLEETWISLARRLPGCRENPTPRQALLFLVGEERIAFLAMDYSEWARTMRPDIDQEVREDFTTTG